MPCVTSQESCKVSLDMMQDDGSNEVATMPSVTVPARTVATQVHNSVNIVAAQFMASIKIIGVELFPDRGMACSHCQQHRRLHG